MTKKQKVLVFGVVLPLVLFYLYDMLFRRSGNWLEDYQNNFKIGFLAISVLGAGWLTRLSWLEKSSAKNVWLVFSLFIFL